MAGKFTPEQREEMSRRWVVDGVGTRDLAEDYDTTRQTVSRNIKKFLDIDDLKGIDRDDLKEKFEEADRGGGGSGGGGEQYEPGEVDPDEWTGVPPEEIFRQQDQPVTDQSPDEFVESFFEDFPIGVHGKFVNIVKQRAKNRGVPDRQEMMNLLLDLSSGIDNRHEASIIADDYWAASQRYLGLNDPMGGSGQQGQRHEAGGGTYIAPNQGGQQGQQPSQPGNYVAPQQSGQQQPQGGGYNQAPPPQQQQYQPPPQQPRQPESNEYVDQLQQRIDVLEARLEGQAGREDEDLHSKANEVVTLLDQLSTIEGKLSDIRGQGGGGGDERIASLERQIDGMFNELQQQAQETGSDDANLAATIATSEGMNPQEKADLIQAIEGPNDPEIKKEEMKLQRQQAWAEAASNLVDDIANAVSGDGDNSMAFQMGQFLKGLRGGGQKQQQPQQQQQPQNDRTRRLAPQHQQPGQQPPPQRPPQRPQGRGQQPRRQQQQQPAQQQQQQPRQQTDDVPPGKARRQASQAESDGGQQRVVEPAEDPEPQPDGGALEGMLDNFGMGELRGLAVEHGIDAADDWERDDYIRALADAGVSPGE